MNKVSENALEESINFAQEICKAAPIAVKTTVQALRRRQEAVGLGLLVIFSVKSIFHEKFLENDFTTINYLALFWRLLLTFSVKSIWKFPYFQESMKIDAQAQAITYKSKDFAEGLMALKEKRPGNFKGE